MLIEAVPSKAKRRPKHADCFKSADLAAPFKKQFKEFVNQRTPLCIICSNNCQEFTVKFVVKAPLLCKRKICASVLWTAISKNSIVQLHKAGIFVNFADSCSALRIF